MAIKRCEVCGQEFQYQRSSARYCSDRCRQRARRGDTVHGHLDRLHDDAAAAIQSIGLIASKGGETEARARVRLRRIVALAESYLQDRATPPPDAVFWVCEECGQSYWGDTAPGYCAFCEQDTEWTVSPLSIA